jgi:hypothetical protein
MMNTNSLNISMAFLIKNNRILIKSTNDYKIILYSFKVKSNLIQIKILEILKIIVKDNSKVS